MHQQEQGQNTYIKRSRYYENIYPKENDLVVVKVVEVQENASYVELLEYNNIKGMITPNEMTKTARGAVSKALKIGQQQVVRVLRVDEEQGYIDLSKKKVQKEEEEECLSRYNNSNHVNAILTAICESTSVPIDQLYQTIVWPLNKRKEYDQPIHFFRLALEDPVKAFPDSLGISESVKEKLMIEIVRRLKPQPMIIRSEFEIQCWEYEGVLLIKEALLKGQEKSQEGLTVMVMKFEMKGSPVYTGKLITSDKNKGIKVMKEALAEVENYIVSHKGKFQLKSEPKVIGDKNQDFNEKMEQVEEEEEEEFEGMGDADDDDQDIQ